MKHLKHRHLLYMGHLSLYLIIRYVSWDRKTIAATSFSRNYEIFSRNYEIFSRNNEIKIREFNFKRDTNRPHKNVFKFRIDQKWYLHYQCMFEKKLTFRLFFRLILRIIYFLKTNLFSRWYFLFSTCIPKSVRWCYGLNVKFIVRL